MIRGKEGEDVKGIQNKVLNESEKLKNIDGAISDKSANRRHKKRIHLVTKPSDVWLHRDGRVHEISFLDPQDSTEKVSDGKQTFLPLISFVNYFYIAIFQSQY